MYDELIKSLRVCASSGLPDSCLECPRFENGCDTLREDAADAIEELQQIAGHYEETAKDYFKDVCYYLEREPKWIPVTERLPEDLARVIVFCNDGVFFGFCEHLIVDGEEVVEWNDFLHYPITPTHWMPIPEPPKER